MVTPASQRRWSLVGSTLSCEKYIGRGTAPMSATLVHVSPLSFDRKTPPFACSMVAYTTLVSLAHTAMEFRPVSSKLSGRGLGAFEVSYGIPRLIFVQVSPPSFVLYNALPSP